MEPPNICSFCGLQPSTFEELREHLESHFGEHQGSGGTQPSNLKMSPSNTPSSVESSSASNVSETKNGGEEPTPNPKHWKCEKCPYENYTEKQLIRRSKAHYLRGGRQIVCDVCQINFSKKNAMDSHRKRHFAHSQTVFCNACGKGFYTKGMLNRHYYVHVQENASQFDCLVKNCLAVFKTYKQLSDHLRNDHDKFALECKLCDPSKQYSRNSLKIHNKMMHTVVEEPQRDQAIDRNIAELGHDEAVGGLANFIPSPLILNLATLLGIAPIHAPLIPNFTDILQQLAPLLGPPFLPPAQNSQDEQVRPIEQPISEEKEKETEDEEFINVVN